MPGQQSLKEIEDENNRITERMRIKSEELTRLDACKCADTHLSAADWAKNIQALQRSLEQLKEKSKNMREDARTQEEQHDENFKDQYRYVIERLKADIRSFFSILRDFIDLPLDFNRQKTWEDSMYDMEMDMKSMNSISYGEKDRVNVDPIVALLNYRDRVASVALQGILFQKAVLDWDMKSERAYADAPMVEVAEKVVDIFSRTEHLPAKYRLDELPTELRPGPFTFNSKKKRSEQLGITDLQCRMLASLREMKSLGKGMKLMKSGEKVLIQKGKVTGKDAASQDMLHEFLKWSEEGDKLKADIKKLKKDKGAGELEHQVEQLLNKMADYEKKSKEKITSIHKLEGDLQSMKYDKEGLKAEKIALVDKNNRLARDNLPAIGKMKDLLANSQKATDRLKADTDMISELFRLMVQENKRVAKERDAHVQELAKISKQVTTEQCKNKRKEQDVQQKETLYLRTMAARKTIHESCQEQRAYISKMEGSIMQKDQEMFEMGVSIDRLDGNVEELHAELKRAKRRSDELEQQKQACLSEYEAIAGQPRDKLLARFKAVPTLPPSVFGS